jgi:hypothetical protein
VQSPTALRSETKLAGLYFGFVGEDRFDEVTRYLTPLPADQESLMCFTMTPTLPKAIDA